MTFLWGPWAWDLLHSVPMVSKDIVIVQRPRKNYSPMKIFENRTRHVYRNPKKYRRENYLSHK